MTPELELAHRLADAADAITMKYFRSPDLVVETKGDGTPVTEVDRSVEAAMAALVTEARPDDAMLGEEIGPHGAGRCRWIFDGIDGTHNYTGGNTFWGTMIGLEEGGDMVLGVITSPAAGRRWWAHRGHGSWMGRLTGEGFASIDDITRLTCQPAKPLADATVLAGPPPGFFEGWRSPTAERILRGTFDHPRNYCWTGPMVAMGELDAALILSAGPWDIAANVAIVEEAGGVFTTLWNDRSLTTTTAVFGRRELVDEIAAVVADLVPGEPDTPVRLKAPMAKRSP